uniref:Etoposide-induced protein 2.4 homolog n=1 Tax=Clastoptera arizonana TaxID=38151 RepID=A0A1B6EFY3_9HEMI
MEGILKTLLLGLIDSIKGTILIFYLDKQIKDRQNTPRDFGTPRRRSTNLASSKNTPKKQEDPKILKRAIQCCLLNGGVFWLSILFFECVLLPGIKSAIGLLFGHSPGTDQSIWSWIKPLLMWTFGTSWVLPLFILSKVVNALWFQDIADSAFRHTRGHPQQFSSVSKLVADSLFSVLVQALFLVQSVLVSMIPIPILGDLLSLVHMCLLYSLYAFEYKWCNMGWELHRRLTYIENNWPYFIGFGLPLAVLTAIPNSYIISGCVFSILFPLFIISGNEADPGSQPFEFRLKLFSPVITISNKIFNQTIGNRVNETKKIAHR